MWLDEISHIIYQTSSYSNMLFTSWTMKSSRAPLKYVIGHWTCHGTTFGLHQEKDVRVTMELEVPKRPYFRPTLSIVMVQQTSHLHFFVWILFCLMKFRRRKKCINGSMYRIELKTFFFSFWGIHFFLITNFVPLANETIDAQTALLRTSCG